MDKTIIALIAVVVIVGAGAYFFTRSNETEAPNSTINVREEMPAPETSPGSVSETLSGTTTEGADPSATDTSAADVVELTVDANNFKFAPSALTAKRGQTVKLTLNNTGGTHDLVIDELNVRTPQISGGKSETVTFVADKAGSFEYYCSVGQHRQMGMVGTLTVTE